MTRKFSNILLGAVLSTVFTTSAYCNRACCFPDGTCESFRTLEDHIEFCLPFGGIIQGRGVVCADNPCGGFCGDGVLDEGEECDGTDDSACPGECQDDCTCLVCGDNEREGNEECDGTDDSACPGECQGDCTCPVCGDNEREGNEECDGTDASACPGECQGDCMCPVCELQVDKTCCIPPSPSASFDCDDAKPITSLTMIWDGPSGVNVVTEGGEVFNNVLNGMAITFATAGLGNDVDLTLNGAGFDNDTSRFHVSCSDHDMNGPEDCGTNQGNGKDNRDNRVNDWLLEGMAGDQTLDCTPPEPIPGPQTETNCVLPGPGDDFDCDDAKPITSLTMIWDGPSGVNVVTEGGEVFNNVLNGMAITFATAGLGNDVDLTLNGAGFNGDRSRFHISCSDNDMDGPEDCGTNQGNGKDNRNDRVNDWLLQGMAGDQTLDCTPPDPDAPLFVDACTLPFGGGSVEYQYTITNPSPPNADAVEITSVFDDQLNELLFADTILLAPGESLTLFETQAITETTTNTVFVNGVGGLSGDAPCIETTDVVTVTVEPSPPFDCDDAKPITSLTMIWDGPSGVNVVAEGGEVFNNVLNGMEITFSAAGLGNDVDLTLNGAGFDNDTSRFHVSCSDRDMNGPEDCGTNQGNGKDNRDNRVNDWLLEGMAGDLTLDCTP